MSSKKHLKNLLAVFSLAIIGACSHQVSTSSSSKLATSSNQNIWPAIESEVSTDPQIEENVATLLAKMTLEQKVAQMIQPEIRDISVEDMRRYGFGSYLNGGGSFPNGNKHATPQDWINLAEAMYQASIDDSLDGIDIPTMWGTDAVHGHNNVIGATLFPHNIGLGAANNPALIEQIAQITATEVMVTGIDWVFAPTVATVRDDRWGRTYESYSENPQIVRAYSNAIVKGLQGRADGDFLSDNRVISTVKHFLGDGGTVDGDDQGDNITSEQELFDIHAQGYVGGLTAGAQSVMATFNSWHGEKIHGHRYLLTDVLKEKMGFDGFVVGDWNGHGQVKGCTNDNCPQSINAGLDMYMVPTGAWKPLMENTIAQVKEGVIPESRIDDAVARILRVKFRAGLFDKPSPANRPFSGKTQLVGSKKHRIVAQQAVRQSLVLLKNKAQLLPLSANLNVLVAGDGADNIGKQSGGWTITWQGTDNTNDDFPGGSSILDGIKHQVSAGGGHVTFSETGEYQQKPDVAIVVFGEDPYAEGHGDLSNLEYQSGEKTDLALLRRLKAQNIPVVSVFISGRPLWVNPELNASDAFVAAWLPGSEGKAVAQVLFKDGQGQQQFDFTGKLSFSWPRTPYQSAVNIGDTDYDPLLPYGFGLQYGDQNVLPDNLNELGDRTASDQTPLVLYAGGVMTPWQMHLQHNEQTKQITSNTESITGVKYRTVDRKVQEDSLRLTFDGDPNAEFVLLNPLTQDLGSFERDEAALVIDWKVNAFNSGQVNLSMNDTSINLSGYLSMVAENRWHRLAIPLSCFTEKGLDLAQITQGFVIGSDQALELEIHRLSFDTNKLNDVSYYCPSQ